MNIYVHLNNAKEFKNLYTQKNYILTYTVDDARFSF